MADRHEVVLPPPPADAVARLDGASEAASPRDAIAGVVADHPALPEGWAALSAVARDPVERYAYARVGYHRGLDALRANRWGGTGLVRWEHPSNRGFLRCLVRLRDAAAEIGETSEVERIAAFLLDLDPDWDVDADRGEC